MNKCYNLIIHSDFIEYKTNKKHHFNCCYEMSGFVEANIYFSLYLHYTLFIFYNDFSSCYGFTCISLILWCEVTFFADKMRLY